MFGFYLYEIILEPQPAVGWTGSHQNVLPVFQFSFDNDHAISGLMNLDTHKLPRKEN